MAVFSHIFLINNKFTLTHLKEETAYADQPRIQQINAGGRL